MWHGLRKSAGRRLEEAGCTGEESKAILGHASDAMIARYTRWASHVRIADASVLKLERTNRER